MKAVQRNWPDPGTAICLDILAPARDLLFVGVVEGELLRALDARGCGITSILLGPSSAEEARVYCSAVHVVPPGNFELPVEIRSERFDAIVFEGAFERLADPAAVLAKMTDVLRDSGFVLVLLANAGYGAARLALLRGDEASDLRRFDVSGIDVLFSTAGYAVQSAEPLLSPVFGYEDVERLRQSGDLPAAVLAAIEADPLAQIAQFAVKALPTGHAAKHATATAALAARLELLRADVPQAEAKPQETDLSDLRAELEAERAARHELLGIVRHQEESAAAIEQRVARLSARRTDQYAALEERSRLLDAARRDLEHATARADDLEASVSRSQSEVKSAREIELERAARLKLEVALRLARVCAANACEDLLQAEHSWFSLYGEIEAERQIGLQAREDRDRARREVFEAREVLASAQLALRENHAQVSQRQERIIELKAEIAQGTTRIAQLERDIAEKAHTILDGAVYARHLEREYAERGEAIEALRTYADDLREQINARDTQNAMLVAELEAIRKAAISEKVVMRAYSDELRESLQLRDRELEKGAQEVRKIAQALQEQESLRQELLQTRQHLAVQTEQILNETRAENAGFSTLIDTVQSSHFWRLKRVLSRIHARARGFFST